MIVMTATIAALVAPSALAQQTSPEQRPPSVAQPQQPPTAVPAQPPETFGQGRATNPDTNVYDESGRLIGKDPDPRVRDQLRHDPPDNK
jgi:hypothetical protein